MHEIITLDNSLRIVLEQIPYVKSVSIGIWVGAGSKIEDEHNNGISHFIEHMMFKGTQNRTARQIAECIDDIGGQINAFTSREATCYYAKTLSSHAGISLNLLADMFFNSLFDEEDIAVEKKVVMEEINMYEDTPEELVHDLLMSTIWANTSIGYPILGTAKTLEDIDSEAIREYMKFAYTPQNSVISVVGDFDRDDILDKISKLFGNWYSNSIITTQISRADFNSQTVVQKKDIEQVHMCIGYEGLARGHENTYDLMIVNSVLGSGMSSRLFQKIREKQGLAYSIYSYNSTFNTNGLFGVYAGTSTSNLEKVSELISSEIAFLKKSFISEREISKSKEQLKSSLILGLESTSSRMLSYGKSMLLQNSVRSMDKMIEMIDSVSFERVKSVVNSVFANPPAVSIVGSVDDNKKIVI